MRTAVEIRDLFRVYSEDGAGVPALQGLSLTVREREVCVVLGPSGSGKSTLLRILAALDKPSAGTVRVFGEDLGRLRGRRLARYRARDLGYAEQHYRRALAEELTARELVGLHLALAGATTRERNTRADQLLERVGLADRRGAHPSELSGGEQQRIAICAALAHRPSLLLADEPTGELDAGNAAAVYELMGELVREEGATTVIVSHDPRSGAIADRIVRVRDGRVSEEAAKAGADETIVVGKGGWLRLSEELLRRAGIGGRAAARLEGDAIVVAPAGAPEAPAQVEPAAEEPPQQAELPGDGRSRRRASRRRQAVRHRPRGTGRLRGRRCGVPAGAAVRGDRSVRHREDDASAPAGRPRAPGRGRGRRHRPAGLGARAGGAGRASAATGSRSSARIRVSFRS